MIRNASFFISAPDLSGCPKGNKPEYAFIGRSNVGKSSLINMLCNKKGLAKTSAKPGKTRLINYFDIDEEWFLVDLPGYGWAKVSKSEKEKWEKNTENYLLRRENLKNTFLLIDSRLPPQKIDIDFINWLGKNGIPFALVFTKSDKLTDNALNSNVGIFKKELMNHWEEMPPFFISSAVDKRGQHEILEYISDINTGKLV